MKTKTFIIIKPDSFIKGNVGKIIAEFENRGFSIIHLKSVFFDKNMAETFYKEHIERPFFGELVSFITSGKSVIMVLERENCVLEARALIGATDPQKADEGTIRKMFAESIDSNAIHGSDSDESAKREIDLFFTNEV